MKCPWCDAEVYQTARYGLYDVDRYQAHYCAHEPLPEPEREVWDTCDCGQPWIRIGDGPRLDPWTRQPHACKPIEPEPPTPHRNGSVEPPPVTSMKPWRVIP